MEIKVLQSAGLILEPNPISATPPGSLIDCKNCAYDRINIYEKARGFKTVTTLSGLVKKFFLYQGKTLAYYLKDGITPTLAHDIGGANFVDYGPVTSTYPMFATSANANFYFTSDNGIQKLDSVNGPIMPAGVPQGLGANYTLITATTGNVIQNGNVTAYRIVWGYTDANNNLVLGAPSPRIPVSNTSGSTKDVELQIQIPDEINSTKFFYQVYRALEVASSTIPLDEMYLVDQITLTSADLLNDFVTFDDHVSVDNLGATIYTAPSEQGIENSYFQPPMAKDIGTFEDVTFYVNTKTKQIVTLILTKTQSTGFGYFSITADTTLGSPILTSVSDTSNIQISQIITGTNIPADTTVLAKTLTTVTLSQNATATSTGDTITVRDYIQIGTEKFYASDTNDFPNGYFNVNTDIENATINMMNAISQKSSLYNGYYLGIGDIDLGSFEIEAVNFNQAAFTVTSSQPTAFITNLPQNSTDIAIGNRLYMSLPGLPESVPSENWVPVGSQEYDIERLLILRGSYFLFKSDGSVYRGVGNTLDTVSIRRFDEHAKLRGIQLPAILNNNIWAYSDQGLITINDNGINRISENNLNTLLFRISKARNSSFETVAFGISYETENRYIMFMNTVNDDTVCTQAFVFNTTTGGFTRWERDASFGFWNIPEDRIYIATEKVKQERKDYLETDYSDDEVDVNITAVNGQRITLNSVAGISVGWSLYQNGVKSKIKLIDGLVVTVTQNVTFVVGAAKVYEPIDFSFTYVAQHYGEPSEMKNNNELFHFVQNVNFESMNQSLTNEDQATVSTNTVVPKSAASAMQPIRTLIPKEQSHSHWLNLTISQAEACTNLEYLGYIVSGELVSERSK